MFKIQSMNSPSVIPKKLSPAFINAKQQAQEELPNLHQVLETDPYLRGNNPSIRVIGQFLTAALEEIWNAVMKAIIQIPPIEDITATQEELLAAREAYPTRVITMDHLIELKQEAARRTYIVVALKNCLTGITTNLQLECQEVRDLLEQVAKIIEENVEGGEQKSRLILQVLLVCRSLGGYLADKIGELNQARQEDGITQEEQKALDHKIAALRQALNLIVRSITQSRRRQPEDRFPALDSVLDELTGLVGINLYVKAAGVDHAHSLG